MGGVRKERSRGQAYDPKEEARRIRKLTDAEKNYPIGIWLTRTGIFLNIIGILL